MHKLLSHRQMPTTQRHLIVWFPLKILRPISALGDQPYALLPNTGSSLALWKDCAEGSFDIEFACGLFLIWNCTLALKD